MNLFGGLCNVAKITMTLYNLYHKKHAEVVELMIAKDHKKVILPIISRGIHDTF